jgi:RNA polymerase sigma factor (sigma-70 family)
MDNPRPLEDMTEAEIEQWYKDNEMNPKGFIECKSTDALNVLGYMDRNYNTPFKMTVPLDELEEYNAIKNKKSPTYGAPDSDADTIEEELTRKEEVLSDRIMEDLMRAAVEALPPRQQKAVRLVIMGGVTKAETARQMNISRQTVGRLITKGLQKLAEHCEMIGGTDLSKYF